MTKRIEKGKRITTRMSEKLWLALVKCAEEHEVSMNFLINEGIKKVIRDKNKEEK